MSRRLKLVTGATALSVLFCVGTALALAARSTSVRHSVAPGYGNWAPNLNLLAAARALPVVVAPGAQLASAVQHSASATGGDPSTALATLRLLRGDLGATHAGLYAYAPSGGAVCVVLWHRQGTCPTAPSSGTPGVELILSPGGAGYVDQPGNVPPAIAGVVSDSVQSLTFVVDNGTETQLPIKNNAFFAEISEPANAGFTVDLVVHYVDGSTKQQVVSQLGPFHISAYGTRD